MRIYPAVSAEGASLTDAGYYYPIEPDYPLTYDGGSYSITGIQASDDNAGLFGAVSKVSSISNLELIDFSITGTGTSTATAGALAGSLTGCTVTNVLARNSGSGSPTGITSPGSAGGLIGSTGSGTTVQYSAAALSVNGSTNAGGLIGSASGTITGCYSGGQTVQGKYTNSAYNVTGGVAGGLVGNAGSAAISSCYSTCSVSGTTVGGFVGSTDDDGGSITNCYCTGLVSGNSAFIGSGSPASTGNQYYRIINEVISYTSGSISDISYKEPGLTGISPIEESFNTFSGHSSAAEPYDSTLVSNYGGKYNLKTVEDLLGTSATVPDGYFVSTHYGDWPSPEIFFVNEESTTTTTNP